MIIIDGNLITKKNDLKSKSNDNEAIGLIYKTLYKST